MWDAAAAAAAGGNVRGRCSGTSVLSSLLDALSQAASLSAVSHLPS